MFSVYKRELLADIESDTTGVFRVILKNHLRVEREKFTGLDQAAATQAASELTEVGLSP